MKLIIPYAQKSGVDYHLHKQYHRFVYDMGKGIKQVAEAHAKTIAEANLRAGKVISDTLQTGFEEVQKSQMAIHHALLDQTQVIEDGFNAVVIQIDKGFEQTQKGLNEVAQRVDQVGMVIIESNERLWQGLMGVKASFDMGMVQILTQFELQRKEMKQGFDLLADLMENTRKTEARECYRDGKEAYETYLQHPDEPQFLRDALDYLNQSIEIYRGNPFCHLYLGHIYQEASLFFDLDRAQEHYRLCATYAKGLHYASLAALGYFLAAWISFVRGEVTQAISWAEQSLAFDDQHIPENYYHLAKFHAFLGQPEQSLTYLDQAVKRFDPFYTIKAQTDVDFKPIEAELDRYFERIRSEAAHQLSKQLNDFGVSALPEETS